MVEATAAEPKQPTAPSSRRPRRKHAINLCCAHSVEEVVGEVARNLRDLGFRVEVVCGGQARAALLGSHAKGDEPTIFVVCVEGSLQERVLKPLRQALAAHAGPNSHLFVAVLDLDVPLAMVGQIRRFAEALERPPSVRVGADSALDSRATGVHRTLERTATSNVPAVMQVVERRSTRANRKTKGSARPRRRSKSLTSRSRAAKIGPTSRHRAVTASHAVVPEHETGVRKRRRQRSRATAAADGDGRVMGLPGAEPRRDGPPPPPATGKLKRRSSTTLPAVTDDAPHPDRARDRDDGGYRFTPPAVKAAEIRAKTAPQDVVPPDDGPKVARSGLYPTIPRDEADVPRKRSKAGMYPVVPSGPLAQAELESDSDAIELDAEDVTTIVDPTEGGTAATLKLDDPPFPEPSPKKAEPTARYGQDEIRAAISATMADDPPPERAEPQPETQPEPQPETDANDPESRPTLIAESASTLLRSTRPEQRQEEDIAESDKTLMRADGTFESADSLLKDVERTTVVPTEPDALPEEARVTLMLDPEDREDNLPTAAPRDEAQPDESLGSADKTMLYSRGSATKTEIPTTVEPGSTTKTVVAATKTVVPTSVEGRTEVDEDSPTIPPGSALSDRATEAAAVADDDDESPPSGRKTIVMGSDTVVSPVLTADASAEAETEPSADATSEPVAEATSKTVVTPVADVEPDTKSEADAEPSADTKSDADAKPPAAIEAKSKPARDDADDLDEDSVRAPLTSPAEEKPRVTIPAATKPPMPAPVAEPPRRSWLPIALAVLLLGGGAAAYFSGALDPYLGSKSSGSNTVARDDSSTAADDNKAAAAESSASPNPASTTPRTTDKPAADPAVDATNAIPEPPEGEPEPTTGEQPADADLGSTSAAEADEAGDADGSTSGEPEAGDDAMPEDATPPEPEPAEPEPAEPEPTEAEPEPTPEPAVTKAVAKLSPQEQKLQAAVDDHRIVMLKTLFASRRQGTATTWQGGMKRCSEYSVDGVKGWRLPHRREMKLINAVLRIQNGIYWTYTVPKDDREAAYVLDSSNGSLSLFLKHEPTGEVLCVRRREFPDK